MENLFRNFNSDTPLSRKKEETLGSREVLEKRLELEENSEFCLTNSLQWSIYEIVHDPQLLEKIDFNKIKELRKQQLAPNSILQKKLRDIRRNEPMSGKLVKENRNAENEIIESMMREIEITTGLKIAWHYEHFASDQIDKLIQLGTMPNIRCILLTPGHAEPLFPQKSVDELRQKIENGAILEAYGGNIIVMEIS